MGFIAGLALGATVTYIVMRHLFHGGWVASDWFDEQLRQIEGRLDALENRRAKQR